MSRFNLQPLETSTGDKHCPWLVNSFICDALICPLRLWLSSCLVVHRCYFCARAASADSLSNVLGKDKAWQMLFWLQASTQSCQAGFQTLDIKTVHLKHLIFTRVQYTLLEWKQLSVRLIMYCRCLVFKSVKMQILIPCGGIPKAQNVYILTSMNLIGIWLNRQTKVANEVEERGCRFVNIVQSSKLLFSL